MLKKLLKVVTNNLGLKILALLSAVTLWVVVVNINDPVQTQTFTASVNIENKNAITEMRKYYEVLNNSDTISFRVSATRSVLRMLNSTDFQVTADMRKIENLERVPIEITALRNSANVSVLTKNKYLEVRVGDLMTKRFQVSVDSEGAPAENCALSGLAVSANSLTISGPEELINQIDSVKATINVEGMASTITERVLLVVCDKDENEVDTTRLDLSMEAVNVTATILDVKVVEIQAEITGTPATGYAYTNVSFSPKTVTVMGSASVLNTVNSIVIPEGIIDISGETETVVQTVDISSYLPDGVSLSDNEDKRIEITVTIEKIGSKILEFPTKNIKIINLSKDYTAEFNDDTISIAVQGLESDLKKLNIDDITVTIDLSGLNEGEHTMTLSFTYDDVLYTIAGGQRVSLTIVKKTSDTTNTPIDNSDNTPDNTNQVNEENTEQ